MSRTFNQWIPLVNISETLQKDGEVISHSEISKMHMGTKHRDLESTYQLLTSCPTIYHSVMLGTTKPC